MSIDHQSPLPWEQPKIEFIKTNNNIEEDFNSTQLKNIFNHQVNNLSDDEDIMLFTDGSVLDNSSNCGSGFYISTVKEHKLKNITSFKGSFKLNANSTILQCELFAIKKGLDYLVENILNDSTISRLLICIDSLGAIYSMLNQNINDNANLINDIKNRLSYIGKTIIIQVL